MFQGTSSDVGKSVITTAICRIFENKGFKVAPFKSQNMSNNSYVTIDGKEIGRAQGVQAEAARTCANVYMNPILLKPRSEQMAEIVLLGQKYNILSGKDYRETFYEKGIEAIKFSLQKLSEDYEYIIIEGAGSPVEINLNDRELVNMRVAELADVPVILIADIDRGGVFASIVGTLALLREEERKRVKGIIINKFRGDVSLFQNGVEWIEQNTGVKMLGVVPFIDQLLIDGEDSLSLQNLFTKKDIPKEKFLDIAVVQLPFISNYTDLEPLHFEEDVVIRFVTKEEDLGTPDAVIIPGTKSSISDLTFMKNSGLNYAIINYANDGGFVVGLCGGYQMLGEKIIDEAGTDTGIKGKEIEGLKLAPFITYFSDKKTTVRSVGILANPIVGIPQEITGYEIHLGQTVYLSDDVLPFLYVHGKREGVCINQGQVIGTYFHHLFHNDHWRTYWLNQLRKKKNIKEKEIEPFQQQRNAAFDQLAKIVEEALDIQYLLELMENWGQEHETR